MLKTSTKLSVLGTASLLGVALFAGAAHAATGSTTAADSPGQVLQLSGVGPAAGHASAIATAHANANAKGLFGATPVANKTTVKVQTHATARPMAARHTGVAPVVRSAPRTLPAHHAATSRTSASSSTWCPGSDHHSTSWSGAGHDMMR